MVPRAEVAHRGGVAHRVGLVVPDEVGHGRSKNAIKFFSKIVCLQNISRNQFPTCSQKSRGAISCTHVEFQLKRTNTHDFEAPVVPRAVVAHRDGVAHRVGLFVPDEVGHGTREVQKCDKKWVEDFPLRLSIKSEKLFLEKNHFL